MARFHFNLGTLAGHHHQPASKAVVLSQCALQTLRLDPSRRTLAAQTTLELQEPPQGPGWFDSSWDLIRGLEVREGLPGDARLHEWLEVCLRAEPVARSRSVLAEGHEQPGPRLVPAAPHGALVDALQLRDLGLAVAAEVAHLDEFGEFGIDGLELV